MIDAAMPTAAMRNGSTASAESATMSTRDGSEPMRNAVPVAASARLAMMEPTYDSNRSAPMPATSPTLSPTLSAMTAALRGSSSGMPASTLPARSPPTSAALV